MMVMNPKGSNLLKKSPKETNPSKWVTGFMVLLDPYPWSYDPFKHTHPYDFLVPRYPKTRAIDSPDPYLLGLENPLPSSKVS